jgi:predicted FMN-binding regulatory protein PaiB
MELMFNQLVGAIVVFEIPPDRIETNFKLNQNRSHDDQRGAIDAL